MRKEISSYLWLVRCSAAFVRASHEHNFLINQRAPTGFVLFYYYYYYYSRSMRNFSPSTLSRSYGLMTSLWCWESSGMDDASARKRHKRRPRLWKGPTLDQILSMSNARYRDYNIISELPYCVGSGGRRRRSRILCCCL